MQPRVNNRSRYSRHSRLPVFTQHSEMARVWRNLELKALAVNKVVTPEKWHSVCQSCPVGRRSVNWRISRQPGEIAQHGATDHGFSLQINRGANDALAPSWSNSLLRNVAGTEEFGTRNTRRSHSGTLWPVEKAPIPQIASADRQVQDRPVSVSNRELATVRRARAIVIRIQKDDDQTVPANPLRRQRQIPFRFVLHQQFVTAPPTRRMRHNREIGSKLSSQAAQQDSEGQPSPHNADHPIHALLAVGIGDTRPFVEQQPANPVAAVVFENICRQMRAPSGLVHRTVLDRQQIARQRAAG